MTDDGYYWVQADDGSIMVVAIENGDISMTGLKIGFPAAPLSSLWSSQNPSPPQAPEPPVLTQ